MRTLRLYFTFLLVFCYTSISGGQSPAGIENSESTISVFDTPLKFTGWRGDVLSPQKLTEIRIGLFMPSDSTEVSAVPNLWAAEMAVSEFNSAGGFHGIPFCLKIRWSYDPWRGGAKEMIRLVYQDSVWAVIGSFDGTATHIAQQIITKARVPLLSPVSADPTLTYIRIPWIFRLPPDFEIQSRVIAQQGIVAASLEKVGLITSTDHDGRTFAKEMITEMNKIRVTPVFHFEISTTHLDINELIQHLSFYELEAMVWYLPFPNILELISKLPPNKSKLTIILPWIPGVNVVELAKLYDGDLYFLQAFSEVNNPLHTIFTETFIQRFGSYPPATAAYTYDAVKLLIHSLLKSGLNRSQLREEIAGIDAFAGVTGNICWDNGGGNQSEPMLRMLKGKKNK